MIETAGNKSLKIGSHQRMIRSMYEGMISDI
jgi:hypothetical protein